MLRKFTTLLMSAFFLSALSFAATAEEIKQKLNGLTVNANLVLAEGKTLNDEIVLFTHGTLTHNGREPYGAIQELLAEAGISSIAPNLSFDVNDRKGEHDCNVLHTHQHDDAMVEIGFWLDWLKKQGTSEVVLMGHSRGGNQTAWYSVENDSDLIKKVVLIAPATWSQQAEEKGYKKSYGVELPGLLKSAQKLVDEGKGESQLTKTNFIYCKEANVTAEAFVSYYRNDERMDTPTLLKKAVKPTLVIIGSADKVVADLTDKMEQVDNAMVSTYIVEDSDHFFLDLFTEELVEEAVTFIEE